VIAEPLGLRKVDDLPAFDRTAAIGWLWDKARAEAQEAKAP
jgi:hypothetical protein